MIKVLRYFNDEDPDFGGLELENVLKENEIELKVENIIEYIDNNEEGFEYEVYEVNTFDELALLFKRLEANFNSDSEGYVIYQ